MRGNDAPGGGRNKRNAWKNHPLVVLLRRIREKHGIPQKILSRRMGLPDQTIRLIETGEQNLPHVVDERSHDLSSWLQRWLREVGATHEEREELERLLQDIFISRFKDELDSDPEEEE